MPKIIRNSTFPFSYQRSVPIDRMPIEFSSDYMLYSQLKKELDEIKFTHEGKLEQLIAAKRKFMGDHFGTQEQIDELVEKYRKSFPDIKEVERKLNGQKTLSIVGGPSGTGKSTLIKVIQRNNKYVAIIDPDDLVTFHPKFPMIQALFGKEWGEMATRINVPAREQMIKNLAKDGYDICVEGSKTYATYVPLALAEKNYNVELHLPIVPPLMLQQRSLKRMADQSKEGKPIRGVMLREYEDEITGHIPLAHKRAKEFFEKYQDNDRVKVTVPVIDIDGQRESYSVENFEEYQTIYNKVTADSNTAQEHFSKLQAKSKRKHLDRVRATYERLCSEDILDEADPYLHTMGVDNTGEKLMAYGQNISVIGKHEDVKRTDEDFERVQSLLESLSISDDNSMLKEQFQKVKQKYQEI